MSQRSEEMIALIDGDIVVHRVGYTTDNDNVGIAYARTDEMLDGILEETKATEFSIYLSDSKDNNYRYQVSPDYKANRTLPRPVHMEAIKEYLVVQWGARFAYGMEADDAMGINQLPQGTVICSIDKDLLQIPGSHYNFVKKQWTEVSEWEGLKWFYQQMLIGDSSDNVKGCKGIGPVKSGRIIGSVSQEQGDFGLFSKVYQTYQVQEGKSEKQKDGKTDEEILSHILLVGRLLKIKQREEEPLWHFPLPRQTAELKSVSTPPQPVEVTPSTEPMKPLECGSPSLGKLTDSGVPASPQL